MYVCICAQVRECELRTAVRAGARTCEAVGDACGAGTGCGTCLDRIDDVIVEEELGLRQVRGLRATAVRYAPGQGVDTPLPATA